jgi:hypothetical protein
LLKLAGNWRDLQKQESLEKLLGEIMQTFLPFPSLRDSAAVLDRQRLGKQRVETMQIMKTLLTGGGWQNHPAVKMWQGYEECLLMYQESVCAEWIGRGYVDTCMSKTQEMYTMDRGMIGGILYPPWFGDDNFHFAHQSNLVRKDPDHYRQYFPEVPDDLEYIWPV